MNFTQNIHVAVAPFKKKKKKGSPSFTSKTIKNIKFQYFLRNQTNTKKEKEVACIQVPQKEKSINNSKTKTIKKFEGMQMMLLTDFQTQKKII